MKSLMKIVTSIFFVLAVITITSAQDCQKTAEVKVPVEKIKSRNAKDYKDWQKIELEAFSFYAPEELKQKEVKCYESGCYTFESENLRLGMDINPAAGHPTIEREYPSYCEKYALIDGVNAWIWSFEYNKEYKYISGVYFQFERNKNHRIGLYLSSRDTNTKEIADRIFKSVKFKSKSK